MRMPAIFVGHGSPMNAIENNPFSARWQQLGKELPKPQAILSISAHWETHGTSVTSMEKPRTIHDFGGFPDELFSIEYPAPGSPNLAARVKELVHLQPVALDDSWGLDHGTWSVLVNMYPSAQIPVIQLSLDHYKEPAFHFKLAAELVSLRDEGVLILGSGNIVHNLGLVSFSDPNGFDWAKQFDTFVLEAVKEKNFDPLIHYENLGKSAQYSIPTNEHYLPFLYILALIQNNEKVSFFNEKVVMGSISMRGMIVGN